MVRLGRAKPGRRLAVYGRSKYHSKRRGRQNQMTAVRQERTFMTAPTVTLSRGPGSYCDSRPGTRLVRCLLYKFPIVAPQSARNRFRSGSGASVQACGQIRGGLVSGTNVSQSKVELGR